MSEKKTSHEHKASITRHETVRGTIVECQTTTSADNGISAYLSEQLDRDIVSSPSTWYFKGTDHKEAAGSALETLTMLIETNPDAKGLYGVFSLSGDTRSSTDTASTPFQAIAVACCEPLSPEAVGDFAYKLVADFNRLSAGLQSDMQLPLPV